MKKILVVGRDPKVCEDLSSYFDSREYRLLPSYDSKHAIASVINLKPDLIILDLNYFPQGGDEIVRELKESNSYLPIIVVTDTSSRPGNVGAMRENVYGSVKRPIQPEKLSLMVKEALSTTAIGREQRELKGVPKFAGLSENPEKVRTDCEKTRGESTAGNKDYDQMFHQLLTPIYGKIIVNSKGNIYDHLISGLEKSLLSLTLKHCNHNQVKASQILGISRNTLRERIKRYDIW